MAVAVSLLRNLIGALRDLGVDVDAVLARSSTRAEELADSTAFLPREKWNDFVLAALDVSGDPVLGLHVGDRVKLQHVVGQLILHSGSGREGFDAFIRFVDLVRITTWTMVADGDRVRFRYRSPRYDPRVVRFNAETMLTILARLGEHFVGADRPAVEVRFRHDAEAHRAEYESTFRCPVVFGAEHDELVGLRSALERPNLLRDEPLYEALLAHAQERLRHDSAESRFVEHVVRLVKRDIGPATATAPAIASALHMSVSTLHRKLQASDESVQKIVDRCKLELAAAGLRDPAIPIKELADRLGYSEVSAFHRAWKRWVGITPAEFREAQTDEARDRLDRALLAIGGRRGAA